MSQKYVVPQQPGLSNEGSRMVRKTGSDAVGRLSGLNGVGTRITESLDIGPVLQEVEDGAR